MLQFLLISALLLLFLAVIFRELWQFTGLVVVARTLQSRGQRATAVRLLERVTSRWALLGEYSRRTGRYQLALLYLLQGEPAKGVEQCERCLKVVRKPASRYFVLQRMADCLDNLGEQVRAAEMRQRAAACCPDLAASPADWLMKIQILMREDRFEEAVSLCAEACEALRVAQPDIVAEISLQQAIALQEIGESTRCREIVESLVETASAGLKLRAMAIYVVCLMDDREWARAEETAREVLSQMEERRDTDQVANARIMLASVLRRRGNVHDALRLADESARESLNCRRMARLMEFECLRHWARWEDASRAINEARRASVSPLPQMAARQNAVLLIAVAWLHCDRNEPDQALDTIAQFEESQRSASRMGRLIGFVELRALAIAGRIEEAEALLQRLPGPDASSRTTRNSARYAIARVSELRGNWVASADQYRLLIDQDSDPIEQPELWYRLGLAHENLDESAVAADCYEKSISAGVETWYVRLAEERLKLLQSLPA